LQRDASAEGDAGFIPKFTGETAMTILQMALILFLFHRFLRVDQEPALNRARAR